MAAKVIIVLCAQVLLMKTVFGYCVGSTGVTRPSNLALPVANLGFPSANVAIANSGCGNTNSALQSLLLNSQPLLESLNNGGVFSVSSSSPITPNGISVSAENLVADGAVLVSGNLPFLGAVAVDGSLPIAGEGNVVYSAGPGVALTSAGCGLGPNVAFGNLAGVNTANLVALNGAGLGGLNVGINGANVAGLSGLNIGCGASNLASFNNNNLVALNSAVNGASLANVNAANLVVNKSSGCVSK